MSGIRVLIAEDEPHLGAVLQQFMTARGFVVTIVRNGRDALQQLRRDSFDVALLDIVMPELDGLEVLRQVRERPLPPEIIMITGNGTIETALAALKLGAYDVLSKPYRMAEIDALVHRAWEKRMLARSNVVLRSQLRRTSREPVFLTQYAPLRAVIALLERSAGGGAPVLIEGAPGVGKRCLARFVHARAVAADRPFVQLDCRMLQGDAFAAELLGTERDASAGTADVSGRALAPGSDSGGRLGALELAAGGTVFLAHVGALDPDAQALLGRVVDAGEFSPVGAAVAHAVEARIIASNGGEMSSALRRALSGVHVALPTLQERIVDVPLLAQHFASATVDGRRLTISSDALDALERYSWPGNIRELCLVIRRAAVVARHDAIVSSDLSLPHEDGPAISSPGLLTSLTSPMPPVDPQGTESGDGQRLDAMERRHIRAILERVGWHQGKAASLLGISPKTLYRKMRAYGFNRPTGRSS